MTSKTTKPQYKTIKVILDNGTAVNIGRASLENIDTLLDVQDRLLEKYILEDGALGKLLLDTDFIADLKLICSLLPVIGTSNSLNFEDIQENWEQLVTLFLNGGFNPETRRMDAISESEVAKLHFLPYGKMLNTHLATYQEREKQSAKAS